MTDDRMLDVVSATKASGLVIETLTYYEKRMRNFLIKVKLGIKIIW